MLGPWRNRALLVFFFFFVVLLLTTATTTTTARAEPESDAKVAARALFHQARELMDAEDYPRACAKFEESLRLDPSAAGTLLNLALCHIKIDKNATAWAELEQSFFLAKVQNREDRAAIAEEQLKLLEGKISHLKVVVGPEVAAQNPRVYRDEILLGTASWGEPMPIDAGDHTIHVSAQGHIARFQTVKINADGSTQVIKILPLDPTPPPPPPPIRRTVGFIVGGTGLAFGLTSIGFGLAALDADQRAGEGCVAGRCGETARRDADRAATFADIATVAGVIGVTSLAVGAVLLAISPNKPVIPTTPRNGGAFTAGLSR
jgi:hypothetical protein